MKRVKAVFAGDAAVGKTCIIKRILSNEFSETAEATVGAANCKVEIDTGEQKVIFNIWDTAGQEKYRSLAPMYFSGASVAFLVFDLTNTETLNQIDGFVKSLQSRAPEYVKIFLVGNKADLVNERQVSEEDGERYAREIDAEFYYEVSAKTGMGVNDLFMRVAMVPDLHFEDDMSSEIEAEEANSNKKCC